VTDNLDLIQLFLTLSLVPYAIAVIMPTWRWLLGVTLIIGGLLSALWIQDWIATSKPDYHEGVGGALGRGLFALITVGFVTGVAIRAVTLILSSRGLRSRFVFAICAAGFAIVPAVVFVPGLWHDWTMRPPSDACLNATFRVKVADADFVVPPIAFFNVYLGMTSSKDAYYFSLNPHLRAFCSLSANGRQQIKASMIWLRFGQYMESPPAICSGAVADWAKTYCSAYGAAKGSRDDRIEFPLDIHVFAPDGLVLGEFGGSRSTYEDSLHPKTWPGAPVFISSDASTPDQRPLTFECLESGSGHWCKTSYPWKDGANLSYSFQAGRDDVAEKGKRIDVETRTFLAVFQAKP
jgi:hypothetical protein